MSRAERKRLARRHKLTVKLQLAFTNDAGNKQTKNIKITIRPTAKRCTPPKNLSAKRLKALLKSKRKRAACR